MTWTNHGPNPKFKMNLNVWTNTSIQDEIVQTECKRCMMHHMNTAPACHGDEVHACMLYHMYNICKIYIMYVLECIGSCIIYVLRAWRHHGDMVYSQYEICNIAEPHGSICGGRSTLSSRSMLVVAAFSSACLCARSAAASSARRATSAMIPRLSNLHYPSQNDFDPQSCEWMDFPIQQPKREWCTYMCRMTTTRSLSPIHDTNMFCHGLPCFASKPCLWYHLKKWDFWGYVVHGF